MRALLLAALLLPCAARAAVPERVMSPDRSFSVIPPAGWQEAPVGRRTQEALLLVPTDRGMNPRSILMAQSVIEGRPSITAAEAKKGALIGWSRVRDAFRDLGSLAPLRPLAGLPRGTQGWYYSITDDSVSREYMVTYWTDGRVYQLSCPAEAWPRCVDALRSLKPSAKEAK